MLCPDILAAKCCSSLCWNPLDRQGVFPMKWQYIPDIEQDLLLKLLRDAYQMLTMVKTFAGWVRAVGHVECSGPRNVRPSVRRRERYWHDWWGVETSRYLDWRGTITALA